MDHSDDVAREWSYSGAVRTMKQMLPVVKMEGEKGEAKKEGEK